MEIIFDMKKTLDLILDEFFFHEISDQNALLFFSSTDQNLLTLQNQLHQLLHEIRLHTQQDASVQLMTGAFQASFEKYSSRRKKRKSGKS